MSYATDYEQLIDDKKFVQAFQLAFQNGNGADMDQAMNLLTNRTGDAPFANQYGGTPTDISG